MSTQEMQTLYSKAMDIDKALKTLLTNGDTTTARMYQMLGYFFGYLDEHLKPLESVVGGKRLRSALCLLLAEEYGVRNNAWDVALAIELFHNFTLIHDDVEDRDETRRNRPTLWKLFGVAHAINAGDALAQIAYETAAKTRPDIRHVLFSAFREVIEGQYMDFELSGAPSENGIVSIERYMTMIEKKTGALFGASTEIAGAVAAKNAAECIQLRTFGRQLGIAFQLVDDYRSIWSLQAETGKDARSDIREHKRTLPFFIALQETSQKNRLSELYNLDRQLSESEIDEVLSTISNTSAGMRVREKISEHAQRAQSVAKTLTVGQTTQKKLITIVDELTNVI